MKFIWNCLLLFLLLFLALATNPVFAQSVSVQPEQRVQYANLPFGLIVRAEGFDEQPQPSISEFTIPGCRVTLIQVAPQVSAINLFGNRSRKVVFFYQYEVEAPRPGTFEVPEITVTQGSKSAVSRRGTLRVRSIPSTQQMKLKVNLPERPLWVGESFPVSIDFFLRSGARSHELHFVVPIFNREDQIQVLPVPPSKAKKLPFAAGSRTLELPYTRSEQNLNGQTFGRFRFSTRVRAIQAGTIELPPSQVVAKLEVGQKRSRFGIFSSPRVQLFKAIAEPRRIEIKPLPMVDRPPSFSNAVGSGFSINVQADRTVVKVGDPVELKIFIRGAGDLAGLSLPRLDATKVLPPHLFAISDEGQTGEVLDGDRGKLFRVTLRLKSNQAREIPALPFSYFDPKLQTYKTEHSQPIALAVQGGSLPTSPQPSPSGNSQQVARTPATPIITAGANVNLSLSDSTTTLGTVVGVRQLRPVLIGIYLLPLLIFLLRTWQVRTHKRRGHSRVIRQRAKKAKEVLAAARTQPARDIAPILVSSLRLLAKASEQSLVGVSLLDQIETEGFNPDSSQQPLPEALRVEAKNLIEEWTKSPKKDTNVTVKTVVLLLSIITVSKAHAAQPQTIDDARAEYTKAQALPDRDRRTQAFIRAEAMYRKLATQHPDRPELLTDWGNAALQSQQLGVAVLAYRRALHIDRSNDRAQKNMTWLQSREPDWIVFDQASKMTESLFFWHHRLSLSLRHLLAALGLALAILLAAPWGKHQRLFRRLALLPAIAGIVMLSSALLERDTSNDIVILSENVIPRSADSIGALPATPAVVPPGANGQIQEIRDNWARVTFPNGITGWLQTSTFERVVKPE